MQIIGLGFLGGGTGIALYLMHCIFYYECSGEDVFSYKYYFSSFIIGGIVANIIYNITK